MHKIKRKKKAKMGQFIEDIPRVRFVEDEWRITAAAAWGRSNDDLNCWYLSGIWTISGALTFIFCSSTEFVEYWSS